MNPVRDESNKVFYTYILKNGDNGKFYTGFTSDLRKRLVEHRRDLVRSTRGRDYKLIYYEACLHEEDARSRELFLKSGMGKRYIRNRLKRFLSLTG